MKKVLRFLSYVLVAVLASCITLAIAPQVEKQLEQSKLDQLSDMIQQRFIGEVDVTDMEDAAADAMVNALGDRWSYYIPADQYASHLERVNNAYVGVGITVHAAEDGSGYEVLAVTKGGPAEEAGLLAGDLITAVNGESIAELGTEDAANLIRGEEGTTVVLEVQRKHAEGDSDTERLETLSFTVERRSIRTVVATGQMLQGNVGLVTIENFDERCAPETIAAIEDLRQQGAVALIFDVRNNPGGYKKELVKVLDYLLPEGPLFRSLDYLGAESVDESDASFVDLPMAVLVNSESYSAAEFFAAAIREYEAGFIVGTQTCGKGYFQVTYQLKDGSAVGLSVGKYFTPNGVSLAEAGGITPDLEVEVDDELFAAIYAGTVDPMDDPQILAAWNQLLGK